VTSASAAEAGAPTPTPTEGTLEIINGATAAPRSLALAAALAGSLAAALLLLV